MVFLMNSYVCDDDTRRESTIAFITRASVFRGIPNHHTLHIIAQPAFKVNSLNILNISYLRSYGYSSVGDRQIRTVNTTEERCWGCAVRTHNQFKYINHSYIVVVVVGVAVWLRPSRVRAPRAKYNGKFRNQFFFCLFLYSNLSIPVCRLN